MPAWMQHPLGGPEGQAGGVQGVGETFLRVAPGHDPAGELDGRAGDVGAGQRARRSVGRTGAAGQRVDGHPALDRGVAARAERKHQEHE